MRGSACSGGLLRYAILTVDHRRFVRAEAQVDAEASRDRAELLFSEPCRLATVEAPLHSPVAVPYNAFRWVHSGLARAGTVHSLSVVELAAVNVAHGEVRQPH